MSEFEVESSIVDPIEINHATPTRHLAVEHVKACHYRCTVKNDRQRGFSREEYHVLTGCKSIRY